MLEFELSLIIQISRRIQISLAENGWEFWYAVLNFRGKSCCFRFQKQCPHDHVGFDSYQTWFPVTPQEKSVRKLLWSAKRWGHFDGSAEIWGLAEIGKRMLDKSICRNPCIKHQWSSGRIVPCHGTDPGSIPGWCMCVFYPFRGRVWMALCFFDPFRGRVWMALKKFSGKFFRCFDH